MSNLCRIPTIRKRSDFLKVSRLGVSVKTRSVIVLCLRSDVDCVGYTASKRVGFAVLRNRAKRRLRALVSEFSETLCGGFSFVFIANSRTPNIDFLSLRSDFRYALMKSKLTAQNEI